MLKYCLIICLVSLSTSVVAQRSFTFKVDETEFTIEEKELNDLFGVAFNAMVNEKKTDTDKFQLWADSFDDWKNAVVKGVYNWSTYGDKIAHSSFKGDIPQEYLGWTDKHKDSTGNPNKKSNIPRRMNFINYYLSRQLIFKFTGKLIAN